MADASTSSTWREYYDGGDPYTEASCFQELAERMMWVQKRLQRRGGASHPLRAFHAKIRLGVENARLEVRTDAPDTLRVGFLQTGARFPVTVRLSNASGSLRHDARRDMRGIALRVRVSDGECHDLLLTNGPVSHARDGNEFVKFAVALAGRRVLLPFRLLFGLGPFTSLRMIRNVVRSARSGLDSLAGETYWSRGAMRWGAQAGRLKLVPVDYTLASVDKNHPDYLRKELADRLRAGGITFMLYFQPFVDEARTPIEDASVEWREKDSPSIAIAKLIIPRQDIDNAEGLASESRVDSLDFNPWYTTDEFRPLGHINRARKTAYQASASHRLGRRFFDEVPLRNRLIGGLARGLFGAVNRLVEWHRLPTSLAVFNLSGFRHVLRRDNLHDTEERDAPPSTTAPTRVPEAAVYFRTQDGSFNDLSVPRMGAVARDGAEPLPGCAFGRNVPLSAVKVIEPNESPSPIEVSERLLARRNFLPARSLNLLAAAWIQFQIHDWVEHPRYRLGAPGARTIKVPLPNGRTWQNVEGGPEVPYMEIADNIRRVTRDPRLSHVPTFENLYTPWWDGGQIYGYTAKDALRLRERNGNTARAELRLDDGFLPDNPEPALSGIEDTGFNNNWWLGLSLMHTLFAREHNVVVAELRRAYPGWGEEALYNTARLIVSAVLAKIHTVEWTPAILATKALDYSLNANWYGTPKDWLSQLGFWLLEANAAKGIPNTMPNHHSVPYSLTEEFVTVYRMHPLIPDDYCFYSHRDGTRRSIVSPDGGDPISLPEFRDIEGRNTRAVIRGLGLQDVAYSFGIAHPGAITLRNYPHHMRNLIRGAGERIDLAVVDLVRDRTRGLPRYGEFRRLLQRPKVRDYSEFMSDGELAREIKELYGDVEKLDTMVGLLAETPPEGFGFSDTAFRVFILMASRRLQSDRFFTVDFRPEVYSPLGLDWIARTGMKEVLERHCPGVLHLMPRTANAFAPWRSVSPA